MKVMVVHKYMVKALAQVFGELDYRLKYRCSKSPWQQKSIVLYLKRYKLEHEKPNRHSLFGMGWSELACTGHWGSSRMSGPMSLPPYPHQLATVSSS